MIDVKKVIKNREIRNELMLLLAFIPDKVFLKIMYKIRMNECLDLDNPCLFSQKMQWLKLYDRKEIYSTIVDKVEVKRYVSALIGEKYIVKTYGIYKKFEDIDFSALPQSFVMKCSHDSGGIVVCRDKDGLNLDKAKKKIERSLRLNYYWVGREWPYKNVKPRILIEKYLNQDNKEANIEGLVDYKFYCFDGVPRFLYISQGLENHSTARIDFLSCDWKRMPFSRKDYKQFEVIPPKPRKYDEMRSLAETLSKGFHFIRVDFFYVNDQVYFSELTLYPGSGYTKLFPEKYDYVIGEMLDLHTVEE